MRVQFPKQLEISSPAAIAPYSPAIDREMVLVCAARHGDDDAFQELFHQFGRRIFRVSHRLTHNREDAEEVVQESFLKAFLHLDSFQGQSRFYTWLVRIAVNEALMRLRKRRPNGVPLDEPIETGQRPIAGEIEDWRLTPEQSYAQQEVQRILAEAIGHLAPSLRIVFQLRDLEQLSIQETAQILALSIAAVKSRLVRARRRLRQTLNREYLRSDYLEAARGARRYARSSMHAWGAC